MRVYVTETVTHQDTYLGEVFVNEQDAKKWIADRESQLEAEEHEFIRHTYTPRELRTAWNG